MVHRAHDRTLPGDVALLRSNTYTRFERFRCRVNDQNHGAERLQVNRYMLPTVLVASDPPSHPARTITSYIDTMFWFFRPPPSSHVVYSSSLSSLSLGYALWHPEPHTTGELQIGDVGYVKDGAFIRLFNINTSLPEHQVTSWSRRFEITDPLPTDVFQVDRRDALLTPGHYCSHGVEQKDVGTSIDA